MSDNRDPEGNEEHRNYVVDGYNYLKKIVSGTLTRGEFLGMTSDEMTALNDFATDTDAKYQLNENKITKNTLTATEYKDVKLAFSAFFRPILIRIEGSPNIISADRLQLNIAEPIHTHTAPGQITDQCIVAFKQFGGGKMEAFCKSQSTQSRAALADNADQVQINYTLVDQYKEPIPGQIEVGGGSIKLEDFKDPKKTDEKDYHSSATFHDGAGTRKFGAPHALFYPLEQFKASR